MSKWRFSLILVARLGLGAVFLIASLRKIQQPYDFLVAVYDYEIVGPTSGLALAMTLPWIEFAIGLGLIVGLFSLGSLIVCVALLFVFTLVQASIVFRGLPVGCGCFLSTADTRVTQLDVLVSASMLAIGVFALWARYIEEGRVSNI